MQTDDLRLEPRPNDDPLVIGLATEQQAELAKLEGDTHISFPLLAGIDFLVGYFGTEVVGCGALQLLEPGVGEVKRMYVRPPYRGRGLSRTILAAIEEQARTRGLHTLRLETGTYLDAANHLYRTSGYAEIPLFGQYVGHPTSICYEKRI